MFKKKKDKKKNRNWTSYIKYGFLNAIIIEVISINLVDNVKHYVNKYVNVFLLSIIFVLIGLAWLLFGELVNFIHPLKKNSSKLFLVQKTANELIFFWNSWS